MNTTTDNEWTMKLKTETYMNMNSTGDTLISTASVKNPPNRVSLDRIPL